MGSSANSEISCDSSIPTPTTLLRLSPYPSTTTQSSLPTPSKPLILLHSNPIRGAYLTICPPLYNYTSYTLNPYISPLYPSDAKYKLFIKSPFTGIVPTQIPRLLSPSFKYLLPNAYHTSFYNPLKIVNSYILLQLYTPPTYTHSKSPQTQVVPTFMSIL